MQVFFFVTLFLLAFYSLLIIYYTQSWKTIEHFDAEIANFTPLTKISVVIPARNEEKSLIHCIDAVINQSYPKGLLEIIVVDDFSTDNTAAIVLGYAPQQVQLIRLSDMVSEGDVKAHKKKAIEIAIEKATGELIVTTDADCVAATNWLITLAAFYQQKKPNLIVMPVHIKYGNRFIEIFQALDFMTLQGITGASVHKKFHSMCNGANLAYTKAIFNKVGGFNQINNIASGDDMLLMHKIFKQDNNGIAYLKNTAVIMQTEAVQSIAQFFNQRIRWASKADKYDDKRIFAVLLLVYLFNCCLFVFLIIALFNPSIITIFTFRFSALFCWVALLLLKTGIEITFLFPVATFFNDKKLLWYFPLLQPFHILYTIIAGWLGKFGSYKWKGRNLK
jgi:cellulose synthase/poly-beta-1,6-N-acetylglucosamine synthase-like glycosyltransferase